MYLGIWVIFFHYLYFLNLKYALVQYYWTLDTPVIKESREQRKEERTEKETEKKHEDIGRKQAGKSRERKKESREEKWHVAKSRKRKRKEGRSKHIN